MLQSPTIDPTRKPLTEAQAKLFTEFQSATRKEEKAAQTVDDLDAQHLTKARKALQTAREEKETALLALTKALASNGHRVTPTGESLEVSSTWIGAKRTFCQPTWRDTKATTTHIVLIGDGKEAIKFSTQEVDEESVKALGIKPILKPVDESKLIDAKATAAALAAAKAKELAKAQKAAPKAKAKTKK